MSLIDDKRVHAKQVITLKNKSTLILSRELVDKVHATHVIVKKDTEWSGILKYKVIEGSIEDPENLVIEALDFLLMDIGTSAYTEYDYESTDEELVGFIMDASIEGCKIGHIHSHHYMRCFFSGTDMSELHDNAPNHNYYLSLIVNYQEATETNWCAKVAFITEEKKKGVKKTVLNYKSLFNSWKQGKRHTEEGDEQEEVVTEDFETKVEYLNIIDLDLKESEEESAPYVSATDLKRFKTIVNKVKSVFTSYGKAYGHSQYGSGSYHGSSAGSNSLSKTRPGYDSKVVGKPMKTVPAQHYMTFEDTLVDDLDEWEGVSYPQGFTEAELSLFKASNPIKDELVDSYIFRMLKETSVYYANCKDIHECVEVSLPAYAANNIALKLDHSKKISKLLLEIFKVPDAESLSSHIINVMAITRMEELKFEETILEAISDELRYFTDLNECDEITTMEILKKDDLPWHLLM